MTTFHHELLASHGDGKKTQHSKPQRSRSRLELFISGSA